MHVFRKTPGGMQAGGANCSVQNPLSALPDGLDLDGADGMHADCISSKDHGVFFCGVGQREGPRRALADPTPPRRCPGPRGSPRPRTPRGLNARGPRAGRQSRGAPARRAR